MSDARKAALLILAKAKPGMEDDGEEDKMPPLDDIMGDLIDAVKSGDKAGAAKAFRAAHACAAEHEPEDDFEDDTEE